MKTHTHITKLGLTASLLLVSAACTYAEQGRNYTTMQREEADSTPIMGADSSSQNNNNNQATSNRQQQPRSNETTARTMDGTRTNRDSDMTRNRDNKTNADAKRNDMQDLQQQVTQAVSTYTALQNHAENPIPEWVAGRAKGILILKSWSGSMGVGGTGGSGIGLKKNADGSFGNPVFYNVAGGSIGLQAGASKSDTVVFLMSDRAVQSLTENRFAWSGNLKAVAGEKSVTESTIDRNADLLVYNQSKGLDIGALVAGTVLTVDQEANRKFYNNDRITAAQIFEGKVQAPAAVASLQRALNNHAGMKNAANRNRELGRNMNQQQGQRRPIDNSADDTVMTDERRRENMKDETEGQKRDSSDTRDEELGRASGEQRREW